MTYEIAQTRARAINPGTFLRIDRLPNGDGFIARFSSDAGLRCYGQALLSHADKTYGLVLDRHGFVPREEEARHLLYRAGVFPAGAPEEQPDPDPDDNLADINGRRMAECLENHYPELSEAANLLSAALCDLRHFADLHGLDFGAEDHTGFFQYLEELPVDFSLAA